MLTLICHSQTKLEAEDIWLSNLDSELSEAGRKAADDIAQERIQSDRSYTAPATHVVEFARLVLSTIPEEIPEFADRAMGTLTGRSYRETMSDFPRRNWLAWRRSYWNAPPEGESLYDISDRVLTAFRTKILPIPSTETVVIVCAADVMRVLLGFLTKIEETDIPKFDIQSCIPYVINGDIS